MEDTKSAKVWLRIFAAGYLVCCALLVVSLFTPIPYGDLTRIGRISEQEFGWHVPPPPIPDANVKTWPIQESDILVIGDSFSVRYAWQSVLVGAGYKLTTTHWDNTGPLCEDFASWLQKSGFKGKVVIVESIERLLEDRIEKSAACKTMKHAFKPTPPPGENPSKPAPGFQLNWDAQLLSGWFTYHNTRAILRSDSWTNTPEHWGPLIDARKVPDGCKQFSHRACDKLLVTAEDRVNAPLSVESARFMKRFENSAAPYKVVWMVVPNKSTVYLQQNHADAFRAEFNPQNIGPDLFDLAEKNRFKMTDLFPANETHVSTQGYILFGQRMLEAVREVLPAPIAKSQ
ncbi:hypothetical protein [Variovorax sp. EBFNA2]|uniref:hypothetical protein n=1 Tax=Variovorax sp. EBFNA2 TaxID=3342097 RepID=UPI0029C05F8E|nr:hypothetical protein [Variovorax boronicumulans]WPG38971.1 hypothetical protein RZE79_06455 [Variovorax boronicumulans]